MNFLLQITKTSFPGAVFFVSSGIITASYIMSFWVTAMLKGKRLSQVIEPHDSSDKEAEATAEKANIAVVSAINVSNRSKVWLHTL